MLVKKKKIFSVVLIIASLAVSACGIKPGTLESPNKDNQTGFPKVYPQK